MAFTRTVAVLALLALSGCGATAVAADPRLTGNVWEDPVAAGEASAHQPGYAVACMTWTGIKEAPNSGNTRTLSTLLDLGEIKHNGMERAIKALIATIDSGYAVTATQTANMDWLCSQIPS